MLRAAFVFFALALVSVLLGAAGFAGLTLDIGKLLLGIFLVLAIVSLFGSMLTDRNSKLPH